MSSPSPEMLIQRQLRAAEIALETARRRRFETDEAVRALQSEIEDMDAALSAVLAAREQDRHEADARIAAAVAAQRAAEQRLVGERTARLALERQLTGMRRERSERDALEHQLAAEARVRRLEGELELVARRASEFEYGVRADVRDAIRLVRELAERVGARAPGAPHPPARQSPGTSVTRGENARAGSPDPHAGFESERLDAALERLRAAAPSPEEGR